MELGSETFADVDGAKAAALAIVDAAGEAGVAEVSARLLLVEVLITGEWTNEARTELEALAVLKSAQTPELIGRIGLATARMHQRAGDLDAAQAAVETALQAVGTDSPRARTQLIIMGAQLRAQRAAQSQQSP